MRPLVLLASIAVLGACSSSPEWVSSSDQSVCTFDVAARWPGPQSLDIVIVVDDSPSAEASRPMLRARTLVALRELVTERDPNDPTKQDAVHDLHVLVRGVSTSYERRVVYLANTPDNAWKTPPAGPRDAEAFLSACKSALDDIPEGTEDVAFGARVSDLRVGEDFLRAQSIVVLLFATAHDESSTSTALRLPDGLYVVLSVLFDNRSLGANTPSGPRACGTFSPSTLAWDPTRMPAPRLAARVNENDYARLTVVCSDVQEAGNLVRFFGSFVDYGCAPHWPGAKCTVLVAPPVSGDDTRCERPDLGLHPATALERRYAESMLPTSLLDGRPVCRMAELEGANGPGEGWYWPADECGFRFTAWAQPVGDARFLMHCSAPKCSN